MAVNDKSKDYLNDFENYLKLEKNFSSHTVRAYCADVLCFLIWASEYDVSKIDAKRFSEYLYFIGNMDYTKKTVASVLFTSFYTIWRLLIIIPQIQPRAQNCQKHCLIF